MKTFSFWHKDTGLFNGQTFATTNDAVALNTPADHMPIEGTFDCLSQRVDVAAGAATHTLHLARHVSRVEELRAAFVPVMPGAVFQEPAPAPVVATTAHVVDYQPPAPSPDHEWNAVAKRWQLSAAATDKINRRSAAQAQIQQLEASQHRHLRELALGKHGAREALQAIDDEIVALTANL